MLPRKTTYKLSPANLGRNLQHKFFSIWLEDKQPLHYRFLISFFLFLLLLLVILNLPASILLLLPLFKLSPSPFEPLLKEAQYFRPHMMKGEKNERGEEKIK